MALGLLTVLLLAALVIFSTRNDWDQAPLCAGTTATSDARCVTEKRGTVERVGPQEYSENSGPWAPGPTNGPLPVDIQFADGSRRHFAFDSDNLSSFFHGGNRKENVVPGYQDLESVPIRPEGPARVIGRFHGRHLVGLRFPATGASLATNDYPSQGLHSAACWLVLLSPLGLTVVVAIWVLSAFLPRVTFSASRGGS